MSYCANYPMPPPYWAQLQKLPADYVVVQALPKSSLLLSNSAGMSSPVVERNG